jgi:hypothetical protein
MLRRYRWVVRHYRHPQPDAVRTLRRDFRATTYSFMQRKRVTRNGSITQCVVAPEPLPPTIPTPRQGHDGA